jgi:hypothetical protein
MWHCSSGLYVRKVEINLDLQSTESIDPGWSCSFEIVSTTPWERNMDIQLDIRTPLEIAGTTGNFPNVITKSLSVTEINPKRFIFSSKASSFLKECTKHSPYFIPIRMMIRGKNANKKIFFNESVDYVIRG